MSRDFDPTDLSAQEAAQSEQDQAKRLLRELEEDDFKWLMGHVQGRRFVWRLLSLTGLFRQPHVVGDSYSTAFQCGEQNIGQRVLAEIHELCPERYHLMVKEQNDARRNAERKRKSER